MTIKPKAMKFRIRRSGPLTKPMASEAVVTPADRVDTTPDDDGFGDQAYPTAAKVADANPDAKDAEIEAIKAEGLTSRQLRIARRIAQKHGLATDSDFNAVRMLRQRGIDPFQRSSVLELVVPESAAPVGGVPALSPGNTQLPAKYDEDTRARELQRIQRDIAERRRRKMFALSARMGAFILLPTILVGIYFYQIATPLYATNTEFLIQQANGLGTSGAAGLLSGTGFATSQDSITVQGYLQSRDAMLRLDGDIGFKKHFTGDNIDFLRRLPADATNEQAYRLYRKMVQIGYDPTEGIVKMEVIATDPEVSVQFSRALLAYAEEQVDKLTQRLRADQMQGAREIYEESETKMFDAQQKVLEQQERLGMIDATTETSALMAQVTSLEGQVNDKTLQLQQLLDNAAPNQARVEGVRGDISRLEGLIANLRAQMTEGTPDTNSLAKASAEMKLAELELETRTLMMQQALEQLEAARIEANRQTRYLSLGVSPTAPDEPTYPRAFENTAVSLLIFAGIYLMMSLTASILREQVSA